MTLPWERNEDYTRASLFWQTHKTAGVILRCPAAGVISLLLDSLDEPVGIALHHRGEALYLTEVPTPGVFGTDGDENLVNRLDLASMPIEVVHFGDLDPTDVAVARNCNIYWTCHRRRCDYLCAADYRR